MILATALLLAGCGEREGPTGPPPPPTPLTIAEWHALADTEKKYEPETLDRLKLADPKLNDEDEWGRFMFTVVVPARKKDMPDATPGRRGGP